MGTNYYMIKKLNECQCCKRFDETKIHIGKSSYGWKFLFGNHCKSYKEWVLFLENNSDYIFDEYDRKIKLPELLETIQSKQKKGIDLRQSLREEPEEGWVTNPNDHEYIDEDGYRISRCDYFS